MSLAVTATRLPEVLVIEPKVFGDERGFFLESFNQAAFRQATGWQPKVGADDGIERLYRWLAARQAKPAQPARARQPAGAL